jgi:hypothetical protein
MKNNIRPTSLKGNDQIKRMRGLMGMAPINEDTKTSVVELTKKGPDGKIYGIVRENHKYFIKVTDKSENLIAEDFNYIGGLKNKTDKAYNSYSQATKQLNLKFISLNEALGKKDSINVLKNDSLLNENSDCYSESPKPSQPDTPLGTVKTMGGNEGHDEEIASDNDTVKEYGDSINEKAEKDDEYKKLFNAELKKMGHEPEDFGKLSDKEKKDLFDTLDKKWDSDKEKKYSDSDAEENVELSESEKAIDAIILEMIGESTNGLKITTAINNIIKGEGNSKKKA